MIRLPHHSLHHTNRECSSAVAQRLISCEPAGERNVRRPSALSPPVNARKREREVVQLGGGPCEVAALIRRQFPRSTSPAWGAEPLTLERACWSPLPQWP